MKFLQRFLSPKGRLSRKPYFLRCLVLLICALIIGANSDHVVVTFVIIIFYSAFILQTIKRLHDLNHSGWWSLLVLVPIVNLFAGAWVLLKKGTKGENKYSLN